ncbi:hypothetical protein ACHWQZ_G012274 [Mnemiopsis leidyi]
MWSYLIILTVLVCKYSLSQKVAAITRQLDDLSEEVNKIQEDVGQLKEMVQQQIDTKKSWVWYLGMNINPADGHIFGYTVGWATGVDIGSADNALTKDYLNANVWESVSETDGNLIDDPIFSVGGDLAFNWAYSDNGCRIALTGGYLSDATVNDDNTHGLGNDFSCNPLTNMSPSDYWRHDISNIQDCPLQTCTDVRVQGTDHGNGPHLKSGPVYGNYAIYVSRCAEEFPQPGSRLQPEIHL